MVDARAAVLAKIRSALGAERSSAEVGYAAIERDYQRHGILESSSRLALMVERLREYDAEVVECTPEHLIQTLGSTIAKSGRKRLMAPEGLPAEWLVDNAEWTRDHGLAHEQIEQAEGVVTAAFCGIAESGTIVLHHSHIEGRRVLTLLPDWHLCVLKARDVVETLPEYFTRCAEPPRLATYVSGPSATADIEMTRIKGVHGPRFLSVVLVRDDS